MKIDKILLIVPPALTFKVYRDISPMPPMGLGYLASVIENMGIEVRILDCLISDWNKEEAVNGDLIQVGLSEKEIAERILDFNPDLIGLNCQFSRQHRTYSKVFSLIKKISPKCVIVAGGAHTTVCPKEVLSEQDCDYVIIGEAENSFKELIEYLKLDKDIGTIDGLGWKQDRKLNINLKNKWISDLDTLPFPAYHLMDLEKYFKLELSHGFRHREKFSPIITSRGCIAKCTFCSANKVWGNKYRTRSIDNVIKEMRLLKDKYGIQELMFEDDNVTADPKRAKELFSRMVEEELDFIWDTPNGVGIWSMDEEMLDLMKQSGCVNVNFPVESGSQRVLTEVIRKPLKLTKVRKLTDYCRKIKLGYGMFFVVGLPGETKKDIWRSFRFAVSCKVRAPFFSVATPYPGTALFEQCKNDSLFSREFSFDDLFIRSYLIKTKEWDGDELKKILRKGLFYLKISKLIYDPIGFLKLAFKKLKRITKTYFLKTT
ncbi:MAG: radical SAM protein [Candidatus Omnitrophica bacterium]|nr:radical SAM protein [Candidatus Omnitrophota bacterium]